VSVFKKGNEGLAEMLDETVSFIRRYVWLTGEQADAIALWVAHSWVMSEWRMTPYLFVTAPDRECGKTLLGEQVLGLLVRKPLRAATATPAALVRSLWDENTTLIHDEIDGVFTKRGNDDPAASELKTVFNAGYQRGVPALKCAGPGHQVQEFSIYCSKVLIGIGDTLPPPTLSRCVRIRMERIAPSEEVADFDEEDAGVEAQTLAGRFEAWSEAIVSSGRLRVKLPRDVFPVRNRERDKWRPLFTIAHQAGEHWPERVRTACLALTGHGAEASYQVQVLAAVWAAIGTEERMASSDLILRMVEADESGPWAGWVETDRDGTLVATRSGETKLARALRHFGDGDLRPQRWGGRGERERGYLREDLLVHVHRYIEVGYVGYDPMVEPNLGGPRLGTDAIGTQPQNGLNPALGAAVPNVPNLDAGVDADDRSVIEGLEGG
jgi:hypothetical protein